MKRPTCCNKCSGRHGCLNLTCNCHWDKATTPPQENKSREPETIEHLITVIGTLANVGDGWYSANSYKEAIAYADSYVKDREETAEERGHWKGYKESADAHMVIIQSALVTREALKKELVEKIEKERRVGHFMSDPDYMFNLALTRAIEIIQGEK